MERAKAAVEVKQGLESASLITSHTLNPGVSAEQRPQVCFSPACSTGLGVGAGVGNALWSQWQDLICMPVRSSPKPAWSIGSAASVFCDEASTLSRKGWSCRSC